MTHQMETRFRCDRCGDEITVPLANAPVTSRISAPDGWATLWLTDPAGPPKHLCFDCSDGFVNFMGQSAGHAEPHGKQES